MGFDVEEEYTLVEIASLIVLAFAVSLDSFGVGITYGMRKIRIPLYSILIIAFCSGMMIFVAMGVAQGILFFLSPSIAEALGGIILIGLGMWALYNSYRTKNDHSATADNDTDNDRDNGLKHGAHRSLTSSGTEQFNDTMDNSHHEKHNQTEEKVWTIEIKKFGLVIQILRTPMVADIDRSGIISGKEAVILGTALALDAFGAGIGAALMGYSPLLTALIIGTMSSLFVYFGLRFGRIFADTNWMNRMKFLPGIILMTFGIVQLI